MYFRVVFCFSFFGVYRSSLVTDVTDDVFRDTKGDLLSAFGDFNADKKTDLFVVQNQGRQVDILLAKENGKSFERQRLLNITDADSYIVCIAPGDFDGDMQMDFLVTLKTKDGFKVEVFWSKQTSQETTIQPSVAVPDTLKDQPLVLDWNADRLPDFLGESDGKLNVWISSEKRNFTKLEVQDSLILKQPHSSAFLDLNNDYATDLLLTKETEYEEWYNVDGNLMYNKTVNQSDYKFVGQTSFADFNQDSFPDIIVPVCDQPGETSCEGSKIVIYNDGKWIVVLDKFEHDNTVWEFVKISENRGTTLKNAQTFPPTLRMGDFNMDGYPDALAILQSSNKQRAFLLINEACDKSYCADAGRKFSVQWDSQFSNVEGAVFAAFFDIYDNGVLDVLLGIVSNDKDKVPQLLAYKNIFTSDACFVKVTVVSGLCNKECPKSKEPFGGSNLPGATIKYKTVTTKGLPQKSCATQLSQSAYYSLQLPYTIFGLGQTPNFVDELGVGMPKNTETSSNHKVWTQIIPNSQLVVIPYPIDNPSAWVLHLFATPSRTIYITGAVLIGTCGFVAGIVGILHLRDRREDKLEKQQESQKFHFDAM